MLTIVTNCSKIDKNLIKKTTKKWNKNNGIPSIIYKIVNLDILS